MCFFCLSKALTGVSLSIAHAAWGAAGIVLSAMLSVLESDMPNRWLAQARVLALMEPDSSGSDAKETRLSPRRLRFDLFPERVDQLIL